MKILALDSSGLVASVALVEDDNMLGEYTVNYKKTHSQTLLPMLDEVAKMIDLDLNSIDAIAVAAGPGSFTGLRIGSATAKGLGLALDKPLIHIPTVNALACNLWGHQALIRPIPVFMNLKTESCRPFSSNVPSASAISWHRLMRSENR